MLAQVSFLLSVWVRVLLIIGLLSVSSSPCNCLRPSHTDNPSSDTSPDFNPCVTPRQISCPLYLYLFTCLPLHVSTFHLSAACLLSLYIRPLHLSAVFPAQTCTRLVDMKFQAIPAVSCGVLYLQFISMKYFFFLINYYKGYDRLNDQID